MRRTTAAVLAASVAACGAFCTTLLPPAARAQTAQAATAPKTLRVALRGDVDTLDPALSQTFMGTVVYTGMRDKLFDIDEHLNIVPMLALSHEEPDPKTVVIHLRPGVLFQDGEPMDAAAVKFGLERDLDLPGSFRRSEVATMDRVDVVDPLTVRVTLRQASAPFVAQLTDRAGMMVSPKAVREEGAGFALHPVCAGPFRFVERVAQDHITLERFDRYWNAKNIHLDRVVYQIMPDSTVRLTNLEAGATDLVEQIAPTDVPAVEASPKLEIVRSDSLGYQGLTFNTGNGAGAASPIGRDARVRRAFELSIDRAALIGVVFDGLYDPTAQAISPVSPYNLPELKPPARDVAAAKKLLAEAGASLPVPVTLGIITSPLDRQVGEVIQSMAAEAGFDVKIQAMEIGSALAALHGGDYQVFQIGWSGLLDPDSDVWAFLHTGGPMNYAAFSDAEVDRLLDEARATADVGQRRALYGAVWKIVGAKEPIVYLWTTRNIAGMSRRVTGYRSLADGLVRLQGVSLAP